MPLGSNLWTQDQFLTGLATGYSQTGEFIANKLFPKIKVKLDVGKYIQFNDSVLLDRSGNVITGTDAIPNYIDFDSSEGTYTLIDKAIGAKISTKEQRSGNKILDIETEKTLLCNEAMDLFWEKTIADMVQLYTNYSATNYYTLDGSSAHYYWSDTTNGAPLTDLKRAWKAVKKYSGHLPDTLIFGFNPACSLAENTKVIQLGAPYNAAAPELTPMGAVAKVAAFLGIPNVYIGLSSYKSALGGSSTDIWGDNVIMAYVGNPSNKKSQTFGAHLELEGYPKVTKGEIPLTDGARFVHRRDCTSPFFVNALCGYLIHNTEAP